MAHLFHQATSFFLKHLAHLVALAILSFAIYFLWNDFAHLDWSRTVAHMRNISPYGLTVAIILTIINFAILTVYDIISLSYLHYKLPYYKIAFTSFIGYVFAGNLGVTILTGGAVRYRFYTRWGVLAKHIAYIMVFSAITLGLGLFTLGGFLLLFANTTTLPFLPIPAQWLDLIGLALLAIVATYLILCRVYHKPFTIRGMSFSLPPLKLSLAQIGIGVIDWFVCATVFYVLFIASPTAFTMSFHTFMLVFIVAQLAAVNSHVPGGIGVFDGLILLMLKPSFPVEEILGTLLIYRIIYYLLPFILALTLFAGFEARVHLRNARQQKAP